ncbi:flavodoxin domain-containing protein [Oceanimonas doudoroffii]|uniref:Nitric oxide synthase n=1 Tax=Oceanimonas doudoroffii TaxID=84158 RepID=A0A233RDY3_9GAMM|nr:flavodoxin domain-containing protein [Oceanimonas doudoroffii]OXY81595.1 nitric oxide synthase [Oceanimonas doudoroffii]
MKIITLFGTETGNAEMVADDIVEALSSDFDASAQDMADFDIGETREGDILLLVCSTYGDGELPNSAQPLYEQLTNNQPNLSHLRFATFGLGDSFYATFNQGSQIMADQFLALGAREMAERGRHDASSGELPGDVALAWLKTVVSAF